MSVSFANVSVLDDVKLSASQFWTENEIRFSLVHINTLFVLAFPFNPPNSGYFQQASSLITGYPHCVLQSVNYYFHFERTRWTILK